MDSRRKTTLGNQEAACRQKCGTGLIKNRLKRQNGADEDFDAKKMRVSRTQEFTPSKDRKNSKDKQVYSEADNNARTT